MSGATQVQAGQRVQAATTNAQTAQAWSAIALNATYWSNYGSGYVTAQYRLVNQVTCEVIGFIKAGTTAPPAGSTVFTLPSGFYNPSNISVHPVYCWTTNAFLGASISTGGVFTIQQAATASDLYWIHSFIDLDA